MINFMLSRLGSSLIDMILPFAIIAASIVFGLFISWLIYLNLS